LSFSPLFSPLSITRLPRKEGVDVLVQALLFSSFLVSTFQVVLPLAEMRVTGLYTLDLFSFGFCSHGQIDGRDEGIVDIHSPGLSSSTFSLQNDPRGQVPPNLDRFLVESVEEGRRQPF